ncbi:ribosomal protein L19 [Sodiomyces alkalinus F11]|uniref:Ribosomal protein L19 n=1 Tax=Sodiomyces alkalinus (strain CBS 110278 / VKM F-3762 / F11) TaxID=1314773 RepID=A0A3N2PJ46_SODAK|nr:ribosomal protein L19 [Sodiomyces alkalinus F11]ROT34460.1 ribosomal protein L19 [Sodiomyces alkalinus F11]
MASSTSTTQWPPRRPSQRSKLRNGTVIIPSTGERTRRHLTLRPSNHGRPEDRRSLSFLHSEDGYPAFARQIKKLPTKLWTFLKSPAGRGVLKCSLAYFLGSLATYLPPVSAFLGKPDGKHVVATITVYFHANRTWGSMLEAVIIAVCAIAYAQSLSIIAMGLSLLGAETGFKTLSHIAVLVLCIGFGLGFVGWVKAKMDNPLVNVGCTLASISIIATITKEEAIHDGYLSWVKIVQIFKILVMGVSIATLVNLLVWRTSARANLRSTFNSATLSLGDMLATISRAFLNGTEEELLSPDYTRMREDYRTAYTKMSKNLGEAKLEHYLLGREAIYHLDREVVRSFEVLTHALGGLRSAAETQFALLKELPQEAPTGQTSPGPNLFSPTLARSSSWQSRTSWDRVGTLAAIDESEETEPEFAPAYLGQPIKLRSPSDIFELFIARLGPSMKSLAYTLSEILRTPTFGPPPTYEITVNEHFRRSLQDALTIYNETRTRALREIYKAIELDRSRSESIQADIEEVAAACGHFSFSLQNVAEYIDAHLVVLEDLKFARATSGRRWNWLKFWQLWANRRRRVKPDGDPDREALLPQEPGPDAPVRRMKKSGMPRGLPAEIVHQRDSWHAAPHASSIVRTISQASLKVLRFLSRDDIRFGIKIGVGAMIWGAFAFLPATRPIYKHWRGEWGLLSYMIVTNMTMGAANTTGYTRFLATLVGGSCALATWAVCEANAVALAFFGWVMSVGSFYVMLVRGKAPLGRTTLLAWNVTVLYAYSLTQQVDDDDDDEGGTTPIMFDIVYHRVLMVNLGIFAGIMMCRLIWPISGRLKFKEGLAVLYLQLGLIWRRGPLAILLKSDNTESYMKAGEEKALQRYALKLDALRKSAKAEFELRGPFPDASCARIMQSTQKILDGFHAMRLVTSKRGNLSPGERALLVHTAPERAQICDRICHVFQVLASSVMLEYPLTDAVPSVGNNKDRLLGKIHRFRKEHQRRLSGTDEEGTNQRENSNGDAQGNRDGKASKDAPTRPQLQDIDVVVEEQDYALLYAYILVTTQVAQELRVVQKEVEGLYGVLDEHAMLLR